jgi:hypothetical protein
MPLYVTTNKDGNLSIVAIVGDDADGSKLTKTLFELSRDTDMTTPFDAAVHTREAIAAGITGHRALAVLGSCEEADLPDDRYFREAWTWSD